MRYLYLLLMLISFSSFARTGAECTLTKGIYKNSNVPATLRFETLVDVFTLNNANTLAMNLDGEALKFIKTEMLVDRYTKQTFIQKKKGLTVRIAQVMIDRTPREVSEDREFYGNVVITYQMLNGLAVDDAINNGKTLTYNFYCEF